MKEIILYSDSIQVSSKPEGCTLTEAEIDAELEKGYADIQAGRTMPLDEAIMQIRKDHGLE